MKASFAAIFRRGGVKAELFGTTAAANGGGGSGGAAAAAPQPPQQQPQQEPTTADAVLVSRKLDELCGAWAQPRGARGMAAGVWRPEAGAVEVLTKGKHTLQSVGFWAQAAAATPAAAQTTAAAAPGAYAAAAAAATSAPSAAAPSAPHRRLYLHIEDAVAMLDAGELMLFVEEADEDEAAPDGASADAGAAAAAGTTKRRPRRQDKQQQRQQRQRAQQRPPRLRLLSLQEAHHLSARGCRVSGARLSLRAHLGRLGYVVGRNPARWVLRAGEAAGAPWRGERGGGWAACDGRPGEAANEEEGGQGGGGNGGDDHGTAASKRRRRDDPADCVAAAAVERRAWWPAVGAEGHPWLSCRGGPLRGAGAAAAGAAAGAAAAGAAAGAAAAAAEGGAGNGGNGRSGNDANGIKQSGNGQDPPSALPTVLSVPNWRYEAWLRGSAAAVGAPPPALPLPPRDAAPLPHPGAALAARFPLLRPLRALSDAELGAARGGGTSSSTSFSSPPPPVLPVLYDVHAASAAFSVREPGRPAFRVGLAPDGDAAAGWALPGLRDMAASELAAAELAAAAGAGAGAGGGAGAGDARPVPVRWAAVLAGGDVAFFSVETARLLDALDPRGAAEAAAASLAAAV